MPRSDQHPRGVFALTFHGPCGGDLLVAVDGNGRRVAEAVVPEGADRQRVVYALREIIDATTPPTPPLYVVDDEQSELVN